MRTTTNTDTLVAVFETNMPAAMRSTETRPEDLRPLVTGRRTPRLRGTKAEHAQAVALIAAMRKEDRA